MKNLYALAMLFFCLFIVKSNANDLQPNDLASLFDHVSTVNTEWGKQTDVPAELLALPVQFQNDNERIQLHLMLVEHTLRQRKSNDLTPQQYTNRLQNLQSLVKYYRTGTFPLNTFHPGRQPVFIDEVGTACAVGHLLQTSGEAAFAEKISKEMNFAYVEELQYPGLLKWATDNGFTKEELAWIQPYYGEVYCNVPELLQPVWIDNNTPGDVVQQEVFATKHIPGMYTLLGGNFLALTSTSTSQSVVAYDGWQWISFGNNLEGTVYTIEYHDNKIFVGGDFTIAGTNFRNLAWWDGVNWQGVQTGNMDGIIKDLASYECALYIGGDFLTVNGTSMPYIAAYDGTNLTASPTNCANQTSLEPLETNGKVNTFQLFNNQLVIGGDFSTAGSSLSALSGFAFWSNEWAAPAIATPGLTHVNDFTVQNDQSDLLWVGGNHLYGYSSNQWYQPLESIQLPSLQNPTQIIPYTSEIIAMGENPPSTRLIFSTVDRLYGLFGSNNYDGTKNFDAEIYGGQINTINGTYVGGRFTGGIILTHDELTPICEEVFSEGKFLSINGVSMSVVLLQFDVFAEDRNTATLEWYSLSETNSQYYQIERSTDLEPDFVAIGQVAAAGESNDLLAYEYADDLRRVNGTQVYYRIKMVDTDGTFEYSDIRTLNLEIKDTGLTIFPNPAKESVDVLITIPTPGDVAINVYDLQGRLLLSQNRTQESNQIAEYVDLKNLTNGLYLIEVLAPGFRNTEKIQVLK